VLGVSLEEGDRFRRGVTIQGLPRIRGQVFYILLDESDKGGMGMLT
jgi:hypothetical protein